MINNPIMTTNDRLTSCEIMGITTEIVAAYVSNNTVSMEEIPNVINTIYQAMNRLANHGAANTDRPEPAVPVKKSVFDDFIICLEDGKKLKMLKRHLWAAYKMTPEQYRERWNLAPDYPMVAPNYAKQRSGLAMKIGLGRRRKDTQAAA